MLNKKLIPSIGIIVVMAVMLAGCGNSTSGGETVTVEQTQAVAKQEATTQKATVTATTADTTSATTAAETQAETEVPTEAPTEAAQETEAVQAVVEEAVTEAAQEIATQAATEAPTQAATQATQATTASTKATTSKSASKTYAGEFNKDVAQQVWAKVNSERAAKGLSQLAWDEDTYEFACQRALAIVKNYSHDGCGEYGENIQKYSGYGAPAASRIHQNWHNSSAHYNNYMSDIYTKGACAVYYLDGTVYAVENFVASWNE